MENFASYEKSIICKTTTVRHTVRIRLNETINDIMETIKLVSSNARVAMIVGDDDLSQNYGEIIFEEQIDEE